MSSSEIRHENENGTDLRASIERLEKRVAKLRQFQSEILNEINELELAINYLKKSLIDEEKAKVNSLRDIPEFVWSRILSLYDVEENDLWSLSLASPDLEKRLILDGPVFKKSCVLKKVMAVLTRRHYLNRDDLLNCFNSGSLGLEDAAAQGWRYLKNTVNVTNVQFNHSGAILRFMEYVSRQRNIWSAFIDKNFMFDNDYKLENYVATMRSFLRKYGRFVFFIQMINNPWKEYRDQIRFFQRLFHILPNVQYFQQGAYSGKPVLSTSFNITNRRNVTSTFKIEDGIHNHSFYKIVAPQCHTWHLEFPSFYFFEFDSLSLLTEIYWKNLNVFELKACRFNPAQYETFLYADLDFSRLVGLKQLILHSSKDYLKTLAVVEKFPQVREVTLYSGWSDLINQPCSCTFPFVKKLTVVFPSKEPPQIDQIAKVLPSLRHFCFRAEMTTFELQNCFKAWKNRGAFQNHTVDIYDLYAKGESLSVSNIWQYMKNLNTLVVESVAEVLDWIPYPVYRMKQGGYTKLNEIYCRNNEGNITSGRETVLYDEWRFL